MKFITVVIMLFILMLLYACIDVTSTSNTKIRTPIISSIDCEHNVICYWNDGAMSVTNCVWLGDKLIDECNTNVIREIK